MVRVGCAVEEVREVVVVRVVAAGCCVLVVLAGCCVAVVLAGCAVVVVREVVEREPAAGCCVAVPCAGWVVDDLREVVVRVFVDSVVVRVTPDCSSDCCRWRALLTRVGVVLPEGI